MEWYVIALLALGALAAAFLVIVFVRAALYNPKASAREKAEPVFVNSEKAARDLSAMIQCRTVSDREKENEDEAEFARFEQLLPTIFPKVHETCTFEKVGDRGLLFRWAGRSAEAPTVLMSHYDVVSASEADWEKGAFSGVIENGVLWGRGTLDTKGTLNGVLQAAEALIAEGFMPERDIYFAFGGDEEINGHGASDIVALFRERGITPGLVVDEGGAVVEKVFPGVSAPCALIGIAEKGMINVKYTVKGGGGHASSPAPHTPVGRLSAACVKMENNPFPFRMTPPASGMFDTVSRHSSFFYKLIFANLWCFAPVLNLIAKASGGEMNAMLRTTTAFTQMEGSKGMNVIPPVASMVSNHRIIPGETMDSVVERIKRVIKDDRIDVEVINGMDPSRVSDTDCEGWKRLCDAVADTWPEAIVSPYLMLAASDSRHWGEISDKVYRFSAMALSKEERATIHGNNERIPLATIARTVEFYIRLMKNS